MNEDYQRALGRVGAEKLAILSDEIAERLNDADALGFDRLTFALVRSQADLRRLRMSKQEGRAVVTEVATFLRELRRRGIDPNPPKPPRALRQVVPADASAIVRPPGHRLGGCLQLLLGTRAFDRVFGQTIADAHEERLEAHVAGDLIEARRVKARAVFYLLWAGVLYAVARVGALVSDLRKLSRPKS